MADKKKSKKKKKNAKKTKTKEKKTKKARKPQEITISPMYEEPVVLRRAERPTPAMVPIEKPPSSFAVLSYLVQLFNLMLIGTGAVISILIYFVAAKRFTKFHALQATFLGIIISLLSYILKDSISNGTALIDPVVYPGLYPMIAGVIIFILVLLAFKTYRNEWIELPLFGGLATRFIK